MSRSRREYYRRTRKARMRELKPSRPGWLGLCFAIAAALLFGFAVAVSCMFAGEAMFYVGSIGLIALIFSAGGMALGIIGCLEENVRPVPPRSAVAVGAVMTALLLVLYIFSFFREI